MTYPIGTLLRDGVGNHYEVRGYDRAWCVDGPSGSRQVDSLTPVPCPPNVVESPTVPDWATDAPVGGMVLPC